MAYLGKTPSQAVRSRYYFTASGSETSLSGADDNSNTLTFTDGNYVDVSLNGVALVAGTDYNTTTANTIGGLSALAANDVVEIIVYDTFSVFGGNVNADLNFKDNAQAVFGDGSDLQIYHDGSKSIIHDNGTGQLKVQTSRFALNNAAGGEKLIEAIENGAVELYYDNVKRFETTSTGVTMIAEHVTIRHTDDGASEDPQLILQRISSSPADSDLLGSILFRGENDADEVVNYAKIASHIVDATDGNEDGYLSIQAIVAGANNVTHARFGAGEVRFFKDTIFPDSVKAKFGTGSDLQIYHNGTHSVIADVGTGNLQLRAANFRVTNSDNTETIITADVDGAVSLYHDNSAKIATTSTGIDVTGTITFGDSHTIGDDGNDNLTLTSSSGENIKYDSAGGSHLFFNNGTEKARFDSSDNFLVGATATASSDFGAKFLHSGTSKILAIHRQASDGDYIQFARGGTAKGNIKQDSGNIVINATDDFQIETNDGTKVVHVDANGNVGIGTTSPSQRLHVEGTAGTDTRILINNPGTGSGDDSILRLSIGGTTASNFIQFGDSGDSNAGQIEYDHGSNALKFTTGATERLVIDGATISTTASYLRMGQGGGGISLTTNDGYGNANITFNHEAGVPEQSGSAYRIETSTDNATAIMSFEMKSSVTADVAVQPQQILRLEGGAGSGGYASMISEGGTEGRVDLQQGSCKAWVRWEMVGSYSSADSYNVSSVADDGVGESVITLNNAMNNSNWAVLLGGTASQTGGGTLSLDSSGFQGQGTTPYRTTTKVHTRTVQGNGASDDADDNNMGVFGDKA